LAYLREEDLFFCVNHPLSRLTGRRDEADFQWFAREFPAFETLNGHMPASCNRCAQARAVAFCKAALGGSDAHTLLSAGTAWTEVPGARSKRDFLRGHRHGLGRADGSPGTYWKLTRDALIIAAAMMRDCPWTRFLAPLALGVPLVTLFHYAGEVSFGRRWAGRWKAPLEGGTRPPAGQTLRKAGSMAA
jgi:hypothetical protein